MRCWERPARLTASLQRPGGVATARHRLILLRFGRRGTRPHSTIDMSLLECHRWTRPTHSPGRIDVTDTHTETPTLLLGTGQFFQRGNYAPVADELTEFDLTRRGLDSARTRRLVPAQRPQPAQATGHWFTGDGMIHGIRVENGRAAWYRNRWVRTDSFDERLPALQRRRHPQPALGRRQHPRRQPRGQDPGAGRVVAALRDHQRPGDGRRLRLRRQAGRLDDRAPQDLPDHRRDALLRLRQHLRALRHLPPRRRQRRADRSTGRSTSRR